jgi:hypothetical protein
MVNVMALGNNTNAIFFILLGSWTLLNASWNTDSKVSGVWCIMALGNNTNAFFYYFFLLFFF